MLTFAVESAESYVSEPEHLDMTLNDLPYALVAKLGPHHSQLVGLFASYTIANATKEALAEAEKLLG